MALEIESFLLPLLFLLSATACTMKMKGLQVLGRIQSKKLFNTSPLLFFFFYFQKKVFRTTTWDNFFFLLSSTKHILRMLYAITGFLYLVSFPFAKHAIEKEGNYLFAIGWVLLEIAIVSIVGLLFDVIARINAIAKPKAAVQGASLFATPFLLLFSPINFLLLELQKLIFPSKRKEKTPLSPQRVHEKIHEFVTESEVSKYFDQADRRLFIAMASFRDRIAKEIMVPRIDIFCLDVSTPIHVAAKAIIPEKYSRIPIYRDTIDNMVGVLLYKDVIKIYTDAFESNTPELLNQTLEEYLTPVLFTPETKRISKLLQEFKAKQSHMAIVVDEYGGTEGIVTIEDILEELVGEIADEYDFDEERLFKPFPSGGWIVDARMNILDIEKELGVFLPQSPEYDTIGGFIYHKAGTIPAKGWRIHTDTYNVEVLSSSERSIDKVWIVIPEKVETPKEELPPSI